MSGNPSPVVAAFLRAQNEHDTGALLETLGPDAVVHDEGRSISGAGLRAWSDGVNERYALTAVPTEVAFGDEGEVVTATVSGTFPGSPAVLRYRFRVDGDAIVAVHIGP